ncbi:MAG: PIN domain-containing protein [Lachnospiraceae bacterium]|nr:PIN domain-containing protein [Lachnospiraceae bacterium]
MRILIDTNVMLDYITKREPYYTDAYTIMKKCRSGEVKGCIAAHSVMNAFYILRKEYTETERRKILLNYLKIVSIFGIDKERIIDALNRTDFKDVEDCLQDECALLFNADFIVTRNITDFSCSKVKALTPKEFLRVEPRT